MAKLKGCAITDLQLGSGSSSAAGWIRLSHVFGQCTQGQGRWGSVGSLLSAAVQVYREGKRSGRHEHVCGGDMAAFNVLPEADRLTLWRGTKLAIDMMMVSQRELEQRNGAVPHGKKVGPRLGEKWGAILVWTAPRLYLLSMRSEVRRFRLGWSC